MHTYKTPPIFLGFMPVQLASSKKVEMIVDLSAPEGHSINDGIEKALHSISYISEDNVAKTILQLGPGT